MKIIKNTRNIGLITAVGITLSACSGTLSTITEIEKACLEFDGSRCVRYAGIIVRPLKKQPRRYIRDKILKTDGTVTHFENGAGAAGCQPVLIEEEVLAPALDEEYVIQYDPALFEIAEFSVNLNANGTISSVGTKSTSGGKTAADTLSVLATTGKLLSHGQGTDAKSNAGRAAPAMPACSHGMRPVLKSNQQNRALRGEPISLFDHGV